MADARSAAALLSLVFLGRSQAANIAAGANPARAAQDEAESAALERLLYLDGATRVPIVRGDSLGSRGAF
jgi:hypothetical protein